MRNIAGDGGDNRLVQPRVVVVCLDNERRADLAAGTTDVRHVGQDHVAAVYGQRLRRFSS
jgi:hypothetical protein